MLSFVFLTVSLVGLSGLLALKFREMSRGIVLYPDLRAELDKYTLALEAHLQRFTQRLGEKITPVRVLLALFGGVRLGISYVVLFLEYVRTNIDRLTRYVALHYATDEVTQSLFLREIAAHKKTVRKPRAPRRKAVDKKREVV